MIRNHSKGFTLIEIVVALFVLGVILGFLSVPLFSAIEVRNAIGEEFGLDEDAAFAIEKISNEIRFGPLNPDPDADSANKCDDNGVIAENSMGKFLYKHDKVNNVLVVDPQSANTGPESIMLAEVIGFSCHIVNGAINLYELKLEIELKRKSDSKTYISRAYHRG